MNERRRLIDRVETACARAAMSGVEQIVTLAAAAPPDTDLQELFADPTDDSTWTAYWHQPSFGIAMVGHGVAYEIVSDPVEDRFAAAALALRDLRSRTLQCALGGADRSPMLIGGFSFFDASEWRSFGSGRLVLPERAYVRRPSGATWLAATRVDSDSQAGEVVDLLVERVTRDHRAPARVTPGTVAAAPSVDDPQFVELVGEAIAELDGDRLSKVVLARSLTVDAPQDVGAVLESLSGRFPTCAIFAFAIDGETFVGASPERLVRTDGVRVTTGAVAATAPRGADPAEDEQIAQQLLADPKETEEHAYVVSEITMRLGASGVVLDPVGETQVMKLAGLQHLFTPITATAPVGTNVLDVVGALHPTPAVAGMPVDAALKWIHDREPLERGWYAAPVGYCDLGGNGEFRVALRSALITPHGAELFAGAGIVRSSSPERELDETSLKLDAMLPALLSS